LSTAFVFRQQHARSFKAQTVLFQGIGLPSVVVIAFAQLVTSKPEWEAGAKAAISLKARAGNPSAEQKAQVWKTVIDAEETDFDLLDDESLLTEEDKKRPSLPGALPVLWRNCFPLL
jgi:hypothetical protein